MDSLPTLENSLELYTKTPESLPLWKTKGIELTIKNILTDVFILSTDLAEYFDMHHFHLVKQNIDKLISEEHLDHPTKISGMIKIGKSAQRKQTLYALTRQQTELLIMDFSGPKAREKKISIIKRFHAMEDDLVQGLYFQALEKVQEWDGVSLLKSYGLHCSVDENLATKKDIAKFLKISEATLNSFLRRHSQKIHPVKLNRQQIESSNPNAKRLHGYIPDDILKITFWLDSEVGLEIKKKIFGKIGLFAKAETRTEMEWKVALSEVFVTLGFKYQHPIGKYIVDFFVEKLGLVLECDRDNHRSYDQKAEQERDEFITQHYALVRFNSKISWETLVNGILRVKPKEVIKLYLPATIESPKKS